MVIRSTLLFRNPPMANPVEELTSYNFYQSSGFWPDQFTEISENLILIPNDIVCDRTKCSARKELALFLMLQQWNKADNWEDVSFFFYVAVIAGIIQLPKHVFLVEKALYEMYAGIGLPPNHSPLIRMV